MQIKRYKIITQNSDVKYYRNRIMINLPTILDLMDILGKINYSGAQWIPAALKKPEYLEVLTFLTTEIEAEKLKSYLPKVLGVEEMTQI